MHETKIVDAKVLASFDDRAPLFDDCSKSFDDCAPSFDEIFSASLLE